MNNTNHPQSDNQLAQRVLHRIEGEHLSPRPRWEFLLKNYVFWSLGALAVVLGALAFSATLFEIQNVDWRLASATHASFFSFFFAAAPLFWIITLVLFMVVGYTNIRHTNHGYRYSLPTIALGAVLLSSTLGSGIYSAGLGRQVEELLGDYPPFYRPTMAVQESWWLAPEKGLLSGELVQVDPDVTSFTLNDFSGRTWEVDGRDLHPRDLITVARGGEVRVVGTPTTAADGIFHACFVFPWEGHAGTGDDAPPRPLAVISSTTERNTAVMRSEVCKGIRPYEQLRGIDGDDE